MTLTDFPLLTDENIDPDVVTFLRSAGFDVFDIKEAGLQGTDDENIVKIAFAEGRVIFTEDGDFCDIVFVQKPDFTGVVHLRPGSFFAAYHVQTIGSLLTAALYVEPPFFISAINKGGRVRIKVRNVLPGPSREG